ncbi:MAG: hypothetical protein AMXMBFR12_04560 [Candidatus Babeliales bacterium]
MKITQFFLVISLGLVLNPVCAAPKPGFSLKTIAGFGAAAGSIVSTGLMGIVDTIKKDKLSHLQVRNAQLENEVNYYKAQELVENGSFKEGFWVGAMLTVLVGCCIAIAVIENQPKPGTGNGALGADILQSDKQEIAKA